MGASDSKPDDCTAGVFDLCNSRENDGSGRRQMMNGKTVKANSLLRTGEDATARVQRTARVQGKPIGRAQFMRGFRERDDAATSPPESPMYRDVNFDIQSSSSSIQHPAPSPTASGRDSAASQPGLNSMSMANKFHSRSGNTSPEAITPTGAAAAAAEGGGGGGGGGGGLICGAEHGNAGRMHQSLPTTPISGVPPHVRSAFPTPTSPGSGSPMSTPSSPLSSSSQAGPPESWQRIFESAVQLQAKGRYAIATTRFKHALAVQISQQGWRHEEVGKSWENLGMLYLIQDMRSEASDSFEQARQCYASIYGQGAQKTCEMQARIESCSDPMMNISVA